MAFLQVYIYFIGLCFLVSLTVFYISPKNRVYLKFFPVFLLMTFVVETLASYMASRRENNVALYNFFTAFEFCFYLGVLSHMISNGKAKKIIWIIIPIYALAAVINILFIQKVNTIHTITYSLGCLLVVSACVYYFLELFRVPKSVKLRNEPAFWICSGLLFFYCCSFPLFGLINYWTNISSISKFMVNNFLLIVNILNVLLYTLFTIAFLCQIKTRKYTLSSS